MLDVASGSSGFVTFRLRDRDLAFAEERRTERKSPAAPPPRDCRTRRGEVNGGVLRLLFVCAGGALGSGARYLVSPWAERARGPGGHEVAGARPERALDADFPRG